MRVNPPAADISRSKQKTVFIIFICSALLSLTMAGCASDTNSVGAAAVDSGGDTGVSGEVTPTYGGTVFYVSNSGDDHQDGLSPETAWESIGRVSSQPHFQGG